jgi:peptidoglycan hydrolase-like protein with peptidoglycan-binding domain
MLLVAVIALAGGLIVGSQIKSPAQLAAETKPPEPGLLTAKVEQRQLTALVAARADVLFADPVSVSPPVPAGADIAVVTGSLPKAGSLVDAGDVLIEVSGRPVFVLPGKFPTYRTLGPGSTGPDVQQLRAALNKLGLKAGSSSKSYDAALASAVSRLYAKAGYPPPGSDDVTSIQAVRDAKDALTDAKEVKAQAQRDYNMAKMGTSAEGGTSAPELALLKQAITVAGRAVTRAEEALKDAERTAWTTMPSGEVIFVTKLPRRVDAVNATVGQTLTSGGDGQDAAIVMSGASISVVAHVPSSQAVSIAKGNAALLAAADGTDYPATVASVCGQPTASQSCDVTMTLDDATKADREALVGNHKVTITVATSSANALVVPIAAVSANMSGQAQVQKVVGGLLHNQPSEAQSTVIVQVRTGLAAEGYIEIESVDGEIHAGDLVVLGVDNPTEVFPEPGQK